MEEIKILFIIFPVDPNKSFHYTSILIIGDSKVKFKTIFILFNSILIFSFFFIFFMPFFIIGRDYAFLFWSQNWYLALLFLIVLAGMNGYFLKNWKLFSLMEEEKWKEIQQYLERKIRESKRISEQNVRILMNTYLVSGQTDRLLELAEFLKERAPKVYRKVAVELGIPFLLRSDPEGLENYYKPLSKDGSVRLQNWARFNGALALVLAHRFSEAQRELEQFQTAKEEPILVLLSSYLLATLTEGDTLREKTEEIRVQFQSRFSQKKWSHYVGKLKENLMVLVLSQFIQDATKWMYSKPEAEHGS
jgi:membrane protein implicated in regulation of membrane protease activity